MNFKTLLISFVLLSCFIFINSSLFAQSISNEDLLYKSELEKYIKKKTTKLGKDAIPKERFLIQQMRMVNDEIKSRVSNTGELRENYFDNLEARLREIQEIKTRLSNSGANSLISFTNDLESRIEETLESGKINYKRQKIFEDGIQLLYIAEEMVNLDPNARLESNPQIKEGLKSSKQKFLDTFGETKSFAKSSDYSGEASIFNLFKEWQLTKTYKYEVRWTDVQILKNKLIRNGTTSDKDRMLKRELRNAATAFNYANYELADRCFEEIINRYEFVNNKDDLYFYQAECKFKLGQYNAARELYNNLIAMYPTSDFASSAYSKLISIAFHFEEYDQIQNLYTNYERISSPSNDNYYNVQLISANAAYNSGDFENTVNIASKINSESDFYFDAQLLLGKAYAGSENLDQAEAVFNDLLRMKSLSPESRFDVLMKLAFINFEKGLYPAVLSLLNQISSNYSNYDQTLMTYSWSEYHIQLSNPQLTERDFSATIAYLNQLTDYYPDSDYFLEAKTLLGNVYQMEERIQSALSEYNYVYRSRFTKEYSDELISERDSLKLMLKETEKLVEKSLANRNKTAFINAKKTNSHLSDLYHKISYTDLSSSSMAKRKEVQRVASQIRELDKIYEEAENRGDVKVQHRAQVLRERLVRVLKTFPIESTISPLGLNYFDEHPLARKESVIEDQNKKILAMRDETDAERNNAVRKIDEINGAINQARLNKDYKNLVHLEIQKDKFVNIEKKLDYLESYSYALNRQESNINLQKWSDFSGFGIANVNFAVKNLKSQKVSEYSDQIGKINQILNGRKQLLEFKIQLIEGEINLMTRQVRQQERLREREELNRKFKESYFDTHTSEVEKSNVVPPQFEEN